MLVQRVPEIEALSISCNRLTNRGIEYLTSLTKTLKHLRLENCKFITDEGLLILAVCKNLEKLELSFCPNLTDKGLICLVKSLLSLRQIAHFWCANLSESLLQTLSEKFPTLKVIEDYVEFNDEDYDFDKEVEEEGYEEDEDYEFLSGGEDEETASDDDIKDL